LHQINTPGEGAWDKNAYDSAKPNANKKKVVSSKPKAQNKKATEAVKP